MDSIEKVIRSRIADQLVHATFKANSLAEDNYRGCEGHKNKHIDLLTKDLLELLSTQLKQERADLAGKFRGFIDNYFKKMAKDCFSEGSVNGKITGDTHFYQRYGNELLDQVSSSLEESLEGEGK